jgi:hypothetical protein
MPSGVSHFHLEQLQLPALVRATAMRTMLSTSSKLTPGQLPQNSSTLAHAPDALPSASTSPLSSLNLERRSTLVERGLLYASRSTCQCITSPKSRQGMGGRSMASVEQSFNVSKFPLGENLSTSPRGTD